jgi:polysaccharide pyruvyl transferase WcaK-like protein
VARDRRCYYLVGPSGFPNYGDELIAVRWLRFLAETDPDADVWLDCHSPGPAQMLLGDAHPRVRFTDTFWRLCWDVPSDEAADVATWVRDAVHDPGRAPRWVAGIELAARADVVHLIGGGYVNALWPRHVGLFAAAAAAAQRSGGTAVATGQGLLPAPQNGDQLLRELVDGFEVVDVRDAPSAQLLDGQKNVQHTCDDAFLGYEPRRREDGREPHYVVSLQGDIGEEGELPTFADWVVETLRAWGARPQQVAVIECIPRTDRHAFDLMGAQLPGLQFFSFYDIWDHGLPVAPAQTWISSRFHPHLLAAAVGARGVALSVRPDYYDVKHESLIELGSGWTMASVQDATPPARPDSGGFNEAAVATYRDQKQRLADRIYAGKVN